MGRAATRVRAADDEALREALAEAGIASHPAPDGALLADADPDRVGLAALRGHVALRELGTPDGDSSLEQLFFSLTGNAGEVVTPPTIPTWRRPSPDERHRPLTPRPLRPTSPGLGRLTAVELRKMVDTRAGFWLPLGARRHHGPRCPRPQAAQRQRR